MIRWIPRIILAEIIKYVEVNQARKIILLATKEK